MDKNLLLHLSLIPGVGPATVEKLIQVLLETTQKNDQKNLYTWELCDFLRHGISEKNAELLIVGLKDDILLNQELTLIKEYHVNWVTLLDDEYPALLKTIHLPPLILYWWGPLTTVLKNKRTVALVGARKANEYGKRVVNLLVPDLVAAGCVTMSGGAYGIDEYTHDTTIKCGGSTVVILGSGLLNLYPSGNKKLFEAVLKSGSVLLSSFPLLMEPLPGNFPARNRIIAGLSEMTVVVQAAQKSGALITARYALDQGRLVGAVPGAIDDELSTGPHALLRSGARLVGSIEDIFDELGACDFKKSFDTLTENSTDSAQKKAQLSCFNPAVVLQKPAINNHVVEELKISDPVLYACRSPKGVDELLKELKIQEIELKDRLFMLQLEGKVEQNFAGLWYKV